MIFHPIHTIKKKRKDDLSIIFQRNIRPPQEINDTKNNGISVKHTLWRKMEICPLLRRKNLLTNFNIAHWTQMLTMFWDFYIACPAL